MQARGYGQHIGAHVSTRAEMHSTMVLNAPLSQTPPCSPRVLAVTPYKRREDAAMSRLHDSRDGSDVPPGIPIDAISLEKGEQLHRMPARRVPGSVGLAATPEQTDALKSGAGQELCLRVQAGPGKQRVAYQMLAAQRNRRRQQGPLSKNDPTEPHSSSLGGFPPQVPTGARQIPSSTGWETSSRGFGVFNRRKSAHLHLSTPLEVASDGLKVEKLVRASSVLVSNSCL